MKRIVRFILAAVAVLAVIQLIGFAPTNPPITRDVAAPPMTEAVFKRGCYDCHSNETHWPWYAQVAPASWLVHHDVTDGRHHLNFSEWDKYILDSGTLIEKLRKIRKTVDRRTMPPWYYAVIHPGARLSDADREAILQWVAASISGRGSLARASLR